MAAPTNQRGCEIVIVHTRLESAHLAGNLLGDPSERDLFVYLPPGYEGSDQRYPTAYLLQAYGETAAEMVNPPADGLRARPDRGCPRACLPPDGRAADDRGHPGRLVEVGLRPMVDSPVTGNFEQYLLHDVVPAVDASYRTIPAAGSRGLFGFSSGGFGAWNVGSRNPDVVGALAMLSATRSWT